MVLSSGIIVGGILAFMMSRYFFRDFIKNAIIDKYPLFTAVDETVTQEVSYL
jgi:uncharacterized membrane protein YdjX (TVP38/TMEM64 family)